MAEAWVDEGMYVVCVELLDELDPALPFYLRRQQMRLLGYSKVARMADKSRVREQEAQRGRPQASVNFALAFFLEAVVVRPALEILCPEFRIEQETRAGLDEELA